MKKERSKYIQSQNSRGRKNSLGRKNSRGIMQRLLLGLGVLGACLSLSGTAGAMEEGLVEECLVGVVIYDFEDDFISLYREVLYADLLECGFAEENIRIVDSENNTALQMKQIDSFIEGGVDVLIINPVMPSLAATITDKAVEAGIPLIYFNREPPAQEQERWEKQMMPVTYVGANTKQAGIMQGEIVAALGLETVDLNKNGKVDYCLLDGEADGPQKEEAYSVQELVDQGLECNCVFKGVGGLRRKEGEEVMEKALRHVGPQIEVVICENDAMALGALKALEAQGRSVGEDVFLVGVDGIPEAMEALREGRLTGTVINDYQSQARVVADAATYYVLGEGNEHYIGCDYLRCEEAAPAKEPGEKNPKKEEEAGAVKAEALEAETVEAETVKAEALEAEIEKEQK